MRLKRYIKIDNLVYQLIEDRKTVILHMKFILNEIKDIYDYEILI